MFAHLTKQVECVLIFNPPSNDCEPSFESINNSDNDTFLQEEKDYESLDVEGRDSSETTILSPKLSSNRVRNTLSRRGKHQVEDMDEGTNSRKKKRKTTRLDSELDSDRFYCPYKRCSFFSKQGIELLFNHIQSYHDYRFPSYDPDLPFPCIRGPNDNIIDLKDGFNRTVEPGQHLTVRGSGSYHCPYKSCLVDHHTKKEKATLLSPSSNQSANYQKESSMDIDEQQRIDEAISLPSTNNRSSVLDHTFKCPYIGCIYKNPARSLVLKHIRSKHDKSFPRNIQFNRKFEFKDQAGRIVHMDGSTKLEHHELIVVEYDELDTKTRQFCPYEMCEASSKSRYKLFSHIRTEHDPEFPHTDKTNIPFTVQTSSGKPVQFTYFKRSFCPYKGCTRSSNLEARLYGHIREVHDPDFPHAKIKAKRMITTLTGEKVDFNGNPQQRRLDPEEKLTFIYKYSKANEAGYCCPFYGCVIKSVTRSPIYQHIREIHDTEFPRLWIGRTQYTLKSKLTNRAIDFKDQFMRKGDSIVVSYRNN
ncbi:hypothetical protein BDC45DRAFT_65550 [Circinella umbellata]|nr:hypothetical protein BDC45DRAFT_65550 [Circinella umbellata]